MPDAPFTKEDAAFLEAQGWGKHVGEGPGLWVSIRRQQVYLLEGLQLQWQAPCATAKAGAGYIEDSLQTPLGWHSVAKKIGADAPWGQVFLARAATNKIWPPGGGTAEDLVLTRLFWLAGEEPGKNQGKNSAGATVDSMRRFIYIHGTNHEAKIGTPSSQGCIRLLNDDAIQLFDKLPEGAPVLITERPTPEKTSQ